MGRIGCLGYLDTVEEAFGGDVDYGTIVKIYGGNDTEGVRRYSPPPVTAITKKVISGDPDLELTSTSLVERQNGTLRNRCRRLTRLTLAFSKKIEHFHAAIGLHYAAYNFVHNHRTIRMTPAMAAGISKRHWTFTDLVDLAR